MNKEQARESVRPAIPPVPLPGTLNGGRITSKDHGGGFLPGFCYLIQPQLPPQGDAEPEPPIWMSQNYTSHKSQGRDYTSHKPLLPPGCVPFNRGGGSQHPCLPSPFPPILFCLHNGQATCSRGPGSPSFPHLLAQFICLGFSNETPRGSPRPLSWGPRGGGLCTAACVSRLSWVRRQDAAARPRSLLGGTRRGGGAWVASALRCEAASGMRGAGREGRIAGAHGRRRRRRAGCESLLPGCLRLGVLWGAV